MVTSWFPHFLILAVVGMVVIKAGAIVRFLDSEAIKSFGPGQK